MTDKISDELLVEIMERRSPSLRWGEAEKIAKELLSRRAAEVKPVELPKKADTSNLPFAANGYNAAIDDCAKAIKDAGGTVKDGE